MVIYRSSRKWGEHQELTPVRTKLCVRPLRSGLISRQPSLSATLQAKTGGGGKSRTCAHPELTMVYGEGAPLRRKVLAVRMAA